MRTAIIDEVYEIMKNNKNSYFITGDLGYNSLEKLESEFKDRFINAGVAEQNMIGMAAGLALSGKKVFVHSIIPFLIMRSFEQIRDDICFHDLDVTLLGIGSGFTYGILSRTHFALEDIAILRPMPNIAIFSPADWIEAVAGLRYFSTYKHPLYVRIGGREEPVINQSSYTFSFSNGVLLNKGADVTIFSTGVIAAEVLKAKEMLTREKGINPTVIHIPVVKPLNHDKVVKTARESKLIFVVEEHGIVGGLGSSICEVVSEFAPQIRVIRIGVQETGIKTVGTRDYLRKVMLLNAEGIYSRIASFL